MKELIVLVDNAGQPIGTAPKLESHHSNTPLHLAFSCYIFNSKGQLLLTQRAHSKKVWPGVWTNSVCGHPSPDEKNETAIQRRLLYELGIETGETPLVVLPDYRYKTPPFNGIIENEICPVYAMSIDAQPNPNPDEVADYMWVDWQNLPDLIDKSPDQYSFWMKDQIPQLQHTEIIKKLTRRTE